MRILIALLIAALAVPAQAQTVPECGGIYLNLNPDAPPYPGGIALQFNFTLVKSPMAGDSSVGCRIPLTQLSVHSAQYVLKLFNANIYWGKNPKQFPFSITIVDDVTGREIIRNANYPTFMISHVGTSGEISSASDWIMSIKNTANNNQSMSAAGMVVGDKR